MDERKTCDSDLLVHGRTLIDSAMGPYAGGASRTDPLNSVKQWGKLSRSGDAKLWLVGRLDDGNRVLIVAKHQSPLVARLLSRMTRKFDKSVSVESGPGWELRWFEEA